MPAAEFDLTRGRTQRQSDGTLSLAGLLDPAQPLRRRPFPQHRQQQDPEPEEHLAP